MSIQHIDINKYLNLPAQESFRLLSANLSLNENEKLKVIEIVSVNPGEGKTLVAISLAIAAAMAGKSVLYVDADLRKSSIAKPDGKEDIKGLTDLHKETGIEDVICLTDVENLKYVTAGNRYLDPIAFLYSQVFDRFIKEVSREYDKVFIDTPSSGIYADSAIIATKAAGVLIVAVSQKTRYKDIKRVKWQMENIGANLIGIVVNRCH